MMIDVIACAALVGFVAFAWWLAFHRLPRPDKPPRLTVFTAMEDRIRQVPPKDQD